MKMVNVVSVILALLLGCQCTVGALAQQQGFVSTEQNPFRWKNVGADPCNPNVGCTLEWALKQTGWPEDVQNDLLKAVTTNAVKVFVLENGWNGWMTWGAHSPKFQKYTVAEWPKGMTATAKHWTIDRVVSKSETEEVLHRYSLYLVAQCKNWGGNTVVVRRPIEAKSVESTPLRPRPMPTVLCP